MLLQYFIALTGAVTDILANAVTKAMDAGKVATELFCSPLRVGLILLPRFSHAGHGLIDRANIASDCLEACEDAVIALLSVEGGDPCRSVGCSDRGFGTVS